MKRSKITTLAVAATSLTAGLLLAPSTAQAVTTYFSSTKIVTKMVNSNASNSTDWRTVVVACPVGYQVTGGGASISEVVTPYYNGKTLIWTITNSFPKNNGWTAMFNGTNYGQTMNVYAICVK
jgi:hypothetical protein